MITLSINYFINVVEKTIRYGNEMVCVVYSISL